MPDTNMEPTISFFDKTSSEANAPRARQVRGAMGPLHEKVSDYAPIGMPKKTKEQQKRRQDALGDLQYRGVMGGSKGQLGRILQDQ